MTRKLLVVEVTSEWANDFIRDVPNEHPDCCHVHELPTAEELGRVALAFVTACSATPVAYGCKVGQLGQAILDALPKRTEGGARGE